MNIAKIVYDFAGKENTQLSANAAEAAGLRWCIQWLTNEQCC